MYSLLLYVRTYVCLCVRPTCIQILPPTCSEYLQLYAYPDSKKSDVLEMMKSVATTDKPTITAVELAEEKETIKSYKCYEVLLKPGTDRKQLLAELNEKKSDIVERVAIVKREDHDEGTGHSREATDAGVCVIL